MRWNLWLGVGIGFLLSLAVLPEGPVSPPSRDEQYRRGFQEGYQSASRDAFDLLVLRKLGEYYFDSRNQRNAFRWYCDEPAAKVRPEDAPPGSAVAAESPRRVTQLSRESSPQDKTAPGRAG